LEQKVKSQVLKDVVSKLDYSNFEEVALVIFGLSFLAICWGAFQLRKDVANRFSSIPIDDLVPVAPASGSNIPSSIKSSKIDSKGVQE
jgi:hypothetical protein